MRFGRLQSRKRHNGWIPFSCFSFRVMTLFTCHSFLGHLNQTSITLSVTLVSAVKTCFFRPSTLVTLSSLPTVPTGGAAEAELERALHPERGSVGSAPAHGSSVGRSWFPLVSHVCRARGVLHGPGQGFPGPGGQAEPAAGGLSWVQLPQSHRTVFSWWVW